MFIGHFAVALAAKKVAPRVSLGTMILSTQLVDLLWPLFLLLGIEHVRIDPGNTVVTPLDFYDYPITHSLVNAVGWSLVLGYLYYGIRRMKREALFVGLGVFSHWILDFFTHRPDLPLAPGVPTYFGLGLWNSLAGTLVVELGLFGAGIVLYLQATKAKDRIGVFAFWSPLVLLIAIYFGNLFGPPPPAESVLAIAGNASWLFVVWGYWIDRHRLAKEPSASPTP